MGTASETVADGQSPATDTPPPVCRRVALLGFGTVGASVARILSSGACPELQLTHIFNRNVERKRVDWVPSSVAWTDQFEDVLASDVDIIAEVVGGLVPAEDWVRQALTSGTSVVTANKQLIAHHGRELLALADERGQQLRFEAAVAGGVPVVQALQDGLAGDHLFRIVGVLNGTCNYILTRMDVDGLSFEAALAEAQKLGFAEADPRDDIEGFDARAKLAILIAVGLRRWVDVAAIPCCPLSVIDPLDFVYARRLGCAIRQVSWAELGKGDDLGVRAAVQPALVSLSSPLARLQGSQNLVLSEGEFGGQIVLSGAGAGGHPTSVAVVSDLLAIARGRSVQPRVDKGRSDVNPHFTSSHYLRFTIADRPGIIASVAGILSRHDINIEAVWQEPGFPKSNLPFVMTLEPCQSSVLGRALEEIRALDFHVRPPVSLPILDHAASHAPAV